MQKFISNVATFTMLLGIVAFFITPQKTYAACKVAAPTTASGYETLLRGPVNGYIMHGDLGKSVKLPNGKILWVFGDTLIGTSGATRLTVGIHNSGLLTENGCITALTGPLNNGNQTTWITPNATTDVANLDDYYWASTPFMDGSTLRMFLSHMYNDSSGFHGIGVDLASFNIVNGSPVLQSIVKTPGSANDGVTTPSWGAGAFSNSSYTYIFGTTYTNTPWVWGHNYYLARVATGQAKTQSSWRYWNGSSWVANQSAAAKIIDGTVGVGSGISIYQKSNREYVMITKKFDMIGSDIVALTASTLTGPWTEMSPALLTIPALNPPMSSSDYTYLGLGHSEVILSSGKLLVNWSLGSSDGSTFGDPRSGIYFGEVNQP